MPISMMDHWKEKMTVSTEAKGQIVTQLTKPIVLPTQHFRNISSILKGSCRIMSFSNQKHWILELMIETSSISFSSFPRIIPTFEGMIENGVSTNWSSEKREEVS